MVRDATSAGAGFSLLVPLVCRLLLVLVACSTLGVRCIYLGGYIETDYTITLRVLGIETTGTEDAPTSEI